MVLLVPAFFYFLLIPASDYLSVFALFDSNLAEKSTLFFNLQNAGNDASLWLSLALTLLQASVIAFCFFIFRYGISQVQHYKMLYEPYMIGISGDSATGKTSLAKLIAQLFGERNTTIVKGDDLHRWERGDENWLQTTHLHPKANLLHLNLQHTLRLKQGGEVSRKQYDHSTGRFTEPRAIKNNRLILFEGLHSFFLSYQKELFDLKLFLKPDEVLRVKWKLERDAGKRGYSTDEVLKTIDRRRHDASYIDRQEQDADLVIAFRQGISQPLALEIKCSNHFYFDDLLDALSEVNSLDINHRYENEYQWLVFEGKLSSADTARLGNSLSEQMDEAGFLSPVWKEDYEAILQLLLLQVIFYKMQLHAATQGDHHFTL
jgi:uridine kinase